MINSAGIKSNNGINISQIIKKVSEMSKDSTYKIYEGDRVVYEGRNNLVHYIYPAVTSKNLLYQCNNNNLNQIVPGVIGCSVGEALTIKFTEDFFSTLLKLSFFSLFVGPRYIELKKWAITADIITFDNQHWNELVIGKADEYLNVKVLSSAGKVLFFDCDNVPYTFYEGMGSCGIGQNLSLWSSNFVSDPTMKPVDDTHYTVTAAIWYEPTFHDSVSQHGTSSYHLGVIIGSALMGLVGGSVIIGISSCLGSRGINYHDQVIEAV